MAIPAHIVFIASGLIIISLLGIIITDKKHIAKLKKTIQEERDKRLTPFLNLSIDRSDLALRIVNEGDAAAQDITIEDTLTTVDVGFQKKILFRFKPVAYLKPGDSVRLDIEIFENNHPVPPGVLRQMGGILISSSFKTSVRCRNMCGISFCTDVIKEGADFKISAITAADPE